MVAEKDTGGLMSEGLLFETLCGGVGKTSTFDILFIHGLTGDIRTSWSSDGEDDSFWPAWLCQDFPAARIMALGYPASVFGKWAKKEMTLYERAENALEHLATYHIGKRPLLFITHSLGGLLAKQILRTSNEASDSDWKALISNTKMVAFIATPHSGVCLAGVLKQFAKPFASTHIAALSNDCGQLDDLNKAYREIAPAHSIRSIAYYEKFKTHNTLLVDSQSADPGTAGTRAVAIDADHITICKPESRDSTIYRSIRRHIQRIAPKSMASSQFGIPDYGKTHDGDRRDLLQKLVDANRETDYASALEHQNIFAKKYYRLGLHTEAKELHDDLLSAVEQRFIMHVYNAAICKNASEKDILAAIQDDVIDPICKAYGNAKLAPIDILRAIYFLTQQCHIKWDHQ
jgi:hypothetical protein